MDLTLKYSLIEQSPILPYCKDCMYPKHIRIDHNLSIAGCRTQTFSLQAVKPYK